MGAGCPAVTALAGPRLAAVRAGLLLDVSVALWRSLAWAVARGYAACCTPSVVEKRTADQHTSSADDLAWRGGDFPIPHFLRGATGLADSSAVGCHFGE